MIWRAIVIVATLSWSCWLSAEAPQLQSSTRINTADVGTVSERSAQGVVEVVVPDLAKSIHFYEKLGFAQERRAKGFVSLRRGNVRLYLAESPEAPTTERWVNLRIIVENVDELWALAQRARLQVDVPLGDRPFGLRDFTLLDPAGFQVRFAQVIEPRK